MTDTLKLISEEIKSKFDVVKDRLALMDKTIGAMDSRISESQVFVIHNVLRELGDSLVNKFDFKRFAEETKRDVVNHIESLRVESAENLREIKTKTLSLSEEHVHASRRLRESIEGLRESSTGDSVSFKSSLAESNEAFTTQLSGLSTLLDKSITTISESLNMETATLKSGIENTKKQIRSEVISVSNVLNEEIQHQTNRSAAALKDTKTDIQKSIESSITNVLGIISEKEKTLSESIDVISSALTQKTAAIDTAVSALAEEITKKINDQGLSLHEIVSNSNTSLAKSIKEASDNFLNKLDAVESKINEVTVADDDPVVAQLRKDLADTKQELLNSLPIVKEWDFKFDPKNHGLLLYKRSDWPSYKSINLKPTASTQIVKQIIEGGGGGGDIPPYPVALANNRNWVLTQKKSGSPQLEWKPVQLPPCEDEKPVGDLTFEELICADGFGSGGQGNTPAPAYQAYTVITDANGEFTINYDDSKIFSFTSHMYYDTEAQEYHPTRVNIKTKSNGVVVGKVIIEKDIFYPSKPTQVYTTSGCKVDVFFLEKTQ